MEELQVIKIIIVVGEPQTVKPSLFQQYGFNELTHNHQTTIGYDFAQKMLTKNGVNLKLQIWDVADFKYNYSTHIEYFNCKVINYLKNFPYFFIINITYLSLILVISPFVNLQLIEVRIWFRLLILMMQNVLYQVLVSIMNDF
ncbi:unnamed protein product (macronuclear) [Paramecium tetraurelia]|uniref:Uncharacterized protein n=1 Tax=Paramecium tetraurelia TaxID=5888 RepID=A0BEE5_PARTE|nr:uncharacterized protein GSPATT00027945001 [Paramecium tetraurelia]CAK56912.1 unnamed protein product [Paramecium tetraurelia]|eukprot:XP_001424310.1 hypothetical protein (macronuclear) [Paramecium tetraurelia strain d4-2]